MPRLIDADRIVYSWVIDNDGEEHDGITLQSIIDKMPTVDAVPVVRCKDCKECEERHTANYLPFLYCKLHEHSVSYNAFCCWAERRKGTDD